jgi:Leucine-rich repeat (LRR) protein
MGLERCDRLRRLDLDHNALAKKENVRVFSLIPRLAHLSLFGNAGLGDYRLLVVATTMFLAGDNRNPGLVSLDNRAVSIDERVAAAELLPLKKGDMPPEHQRWRYLLIKNFGHKQLRVRQFAEAIRVCSFRSAKLTVVQLSMFKQLTVLDLKHNNLVDVPGLDGLPLLKLLNLTNNPKLNLSGVLQDLRKTAALEQVFFAVLDVEGHKRAPGAPKYVSTVVTALFDHTQLRFLDGSPLPPQTRVEAYAARGASPQEAEHYRWRLALNASCTLGFNRQHHPLFVDIGAQYDPAQITALRRMSGYGLRSGVIDLSVFVMLQQLSIASNLLTTTVGLGLERLRELRRLELHDNEIRQPVGELAALFDRLEQLEIVTLRNNPVMRAPDTRARLIGALVSQRRVATTLRIIDTPITVAERCDAWQAFGGGSASDVAALREPALLALRCPVEAHERAALTVLDLSDGKLEQIDVRQFPALVHLSLAGNSLVALARIVGLLDLSHLRSLNLQRNLLASVDEVIRLLSSLMLYSVGLAHNPLADVKRPWRARIIAGLPALTSGGCVLRRIDDQLLTPAEICGAHGKLVGRDEEPDAFRFRVAMLRQVPLDVAVGELVELDLSHCDLKFKRADLSVLRSIKRLSLAHNQMHPKHMPLCNVVRLKTLEELDLSHNQLSLLKMLSALIERLPLLKAFAFDHNPCHPMSGIEQSRVAALIASAPCTLNVASQLKHINGAVLPDNLRVAVAMRELGKGVGEQLAADLAVADVGPSCLVLDLSKRGLCVMSSLSRLRNLTALLLPNNALHTLAPNLLEPLPVLRKLDLRFNQLASLDAIVEVVLGSKSLQSLYILEATADRRITLVVEAFAPRVISAVPTLLHVDGFANQRPAPRAVPRDLPMPPPSDGDDEPPASVEDSVRQSASAPYQEAWADRYMRRYSAKPGDAAAASARFAQMAAEEDDLFAFGAERGVSGINSSALSGAVYGDDDFVPNFPSAPPAAAVVEPAAIADVEQSPLTTSEPTDLPDPDVDDDVASIERSSSSGSPPPPPTAEDDDDAPVAQPSRPTPTSTTICQRIIASRCTDCRLTTPL